MTLSLDELALVLQALRGSVQDGPLADLLTRIEAHLEANAAHPDSAASAPEAPAEEAPEAPVEAPAEAPAPADAPKSTDAAAA